MLLETGKPSSTLVICHLAPFCHLHCKISTATKHPHAHNQPHLKKLYGKCTHTDKIATVLEQQSHLLPLYCGIHVNNHFFLSKIAWYNDAFVL